MWLGGSVPQVRPSPRGLTEEVPHFGTPLVQRVWPACASLPVLTAPLFASKKGSTNSSWSFRQSPKLCFKLWNTYFALKALISGSSKTCWPERHCCLFRHVGFLPPLNERKRGGVGGALSLLYVWSYWTPFIRKTLFIRYFIIHHRYTALQMERFTLYPTSKRDTGFKR